MELSAQSLAPYLNGTPRFAHEIADSYNTTTGRYTLSLLERIALRMSGTPVRITWEQVSRVLDDAHGVARSDQYYDIEWDPRSTTASPIKAGWYPMYAKHP